MNIERMFTDVTTEELPRLLRLLNAQGATVSQQRQSDGQLTTVTAVLHVADPVAAVSSVAAVGSMHSVATATSVGGGPGPASATADNVPWLTVAEGEIGVKEVVGAGHNPRILEYHATTTLGAKTDEVPWCSSFVNFCVEKSGLKGTRSAAARSWLKWGRSIESPVPGCIVVLTRGSNPSQGHVGFYMGEEAGFIRLLGGNQANAVNISSHPASKLLGYRMPT